MIKKWYETCFLKVEMVTSVLFIADAAALILYQRLIESLELSVKRILFNKALREQLQHYTADVVVLDCGIYLKDGLKILKQLRLSIPASRIIFICEFYSKKIFRDVLQAGAREFLVRPVELKGLKEIIYRLAGKKDRSSSRYPEGILRSLQYIEEHLTEDLSLSTLSRVANLSKYHYCRLFKKHTGMSPIKYLNHKRIAQAKYLLSISELPISTICHQTGFNDLGNFIKRFKAITGLTPTLYRKKFKRQ